MRIVMPAVVSHTDIDPYMAMARFETGPGGNPHWHRMSVGRRCPQFRHVKDDVGAAGDMPPETLSEDVVVCRRLWERRDSSAWPEGVEKSGVAVESLIRRALSDDLPQSAAPDLSKRQTMAPQSVLREMLPPMGMHALTMRLSIFSQDE